LTDLNPLNVIQASALVRFESPQRDSKLEA
jgi:hypothetical protein